MRRARRASAGLAAVGALLLSGCATLPATGVRDHVATLNGAVVPSPDAAYRFELAERAEDLGTIRGRSIDAGAGSDPGLRTVLADGLTPDTAYVYRLCAAGTARCFDSQALRTWTTHRAAVCPAPTSPLLPRCDTVFAVSNLTTTGVSVLKGTFLLDAPHHGFLEAAATPAAFGTPAAQRSPERALEGQFAGVSGRLEGLAPGTAYLVRACVRRDADGDVACDEPVPLATRYVTPSYVRRGGHVRILGGDGGAYGAALEDANVDARAAADGSDVSGGASAEISFVLGQPIRSIRGTVSCLSVTGARAVVGVRSADDPAQAQWTFFVEDNGGSGRDAVDGVPGRNADDCSPQRFGETTRRAVLAEGRATVEAAVGVAAGFPR